MRFSTIKPAGHFVLDRKHPLSKGLLIAYIFETNRGSSDRGLYYQNWANPSIFNLRPEYSTCSMAPLSGGGQHGGVRKWNWTEVYCLTTSGWEPSAWHPLGHFSIVSRALAFNSLDSAGSSHGVSMFCGSVNGTAGFLVYGGGNVNNLKMIMTRLGISGVSGNTVLQHDRWYTMGISYKPNVSHEFFLNGNSDGEGSNGQTFSSSSIHGVGGRNGYNEGGRCGVEYVYVWNRYLSPSEHKAVTAAPYQMFKSIYTPVFKSYTTFQSRYVLPSFRPSF